MLCIPTDAFRNVRLPSPIRVTGRLQARLVLGHVIREDEPGGARDVDDSARLREGRVDDLCEERGTQRPWHTHTNILIIFGSPLYDKVSSQGRFAPLENEIL